MRKLAVAAIALGAIAVATPALAGPGQCYDRFGRQVGGIYDTDNPNYNFIQWVQRRGGHCARVGENNYRPNYGPRYPYGGYQRDNYYNSPSYYYRGQGYDRY